MSHPRVLFRDGGEATGMDEQAVFDRVETTADEPAELFEHFERRKHEDLTYHALSEARHGLERGTVVVKEELVAGFPSVPRVLDLGTGLRSFFDADDGPVIVEEKLNGSNVRIADVGPDSPLAFTRSGHICPWTTKRARELLPLASFFADHPERQLCAELIGPETPYTDHDYAGVDSHTFRLFDVRDRATGEPMPVVDRRAVAERYGLPQPRRFGSGTPDEVVETVRDAVATLAEAGREGIVARSADGTQLVKYTTQPQHHTELAHAFSIPFDVGRDFLFSRVVREAFQSAEFDDPAARRERARDLGASILLPMVETIEAVDRGDIVGERKTVRGDPADVDDLLDHLRNQGLDLEISSDRREGDTRVVEFVKVAASTRDQVDHYLSGGTYDE